jgi:5-formyltetrahydrofolate cyclo-ligase
VSRIPSRRLRRWKRALRREVLARRDALSGSERERMSAAIVARALALPEVRQARSVMAFWSFGSEVDTGPILARLHAAGKEVSLPRIQGREVVPVPYVPGVAMRRTSFGAMEPAGSALDPRSIDVVLTPGVAFDRRGNRVGYGHGYYDRLLGRVRPETAKVALAFGLQVVEEVPAGSADRPVDLVVTEREVIRCEAA